MTARLLLATTNPGKLREVKAVLADLPVDIRTLADYPDLSAPPEVGSTFEANAVDKAHYYARQAGGWALADDSGLEVDALGGEPGVRSARYAGPDADDAANNTLLIRRLREVGASDRAARFHCVCALANPDGVVATGSGTVSGRIVDEPRGSNGFGYDPHFFIPEKGLTAAELPPDEKNRISHRGRALRAIRPAIERWVVRSAG